ncbi:UNVERIFIED_CONTAM: cytochrome [Sesamum radiatum]|uniref:Cytochrome n=1 Tax=Sesamum radiatum TaxID=300843 RepID=A0AAW2VAJ3_SESRA
MLPPGPPKWPIFGNLLQLGQLPHRDFAALCEKYGPLVYIQLGNIDAITTNDPDIIREILRQQDDVFPPGHGPWQLSTWPMGVVMWRWLLWAQNGSDCEGFAWSIC